MKRMIITLLLLLGVSFRLLAIIIGSNTTPSRPALANFPSADGDNEMRGFGAFENGFSLEDNATSCIFNSFFPVGGTNTFNSGTINLSLPLIFDSNATFADGGTINGNSLSVSLPDKVAAFSFGGAMTLDALELILRSNLVLNGITTFKNNCTIEGNGYTIDLSNGSIAAASGASVFIKNVTLSGITDGKIYCADSTGTFSLQDVTWVQDGYYRFTQGRLDVLGKLKITGGEFGFGYESDQVSTIKQDATWFFDSGMTFSYNPSASASLIAMEDATALLQFYETTLYATTVGWELTKGTVVVDGTCPVQSDATQESEGIRLGDGTAANDIDLKVFPESGFRVDSGYLVQKIVN